MSWSIYADNRVEYAWFASLSTQLLSASYCVIGRRGTNPPAVERLISYDRPDIILLENGNPRLVVEQTREVPTGHNVGQRMARLVRAVELGVPTIKFFPFDARKHGKHSSMCYMNARILRSFIDIVRIHKTPLVAVNWPCDKDGELIDDGLQNIEMSAIVDDYLSNNCQPSSPFLQKQICSNVAEYEKRIRLDERYGYPPRSVNIEQTVEFKQSLEGVGHFPDDLLLLEETVIYTIEMSEDKCRRQDPYTGMQFIYDYIYCRSGPGPMEKRRNLVLFFPKIRKEVWEQKNPNNTDTKSCNWYLIASALVFSNGIIVPSR